MLVRAINFEDGDVGSSAPGDTAPVVRRSGRICCRQISLDDIEMILDLLCEGFKRRPRRHWVSAFEIMNLRPVPAGQPRFGYLIENNGTAVGVLLVIATELHHNGTTKVRSNRSSWYVRPAFRAYASILLTQWMRSGSDIYLNVFPAEHTFPIIEARGFVRFANGIFLSAPAIAPQAGRSRILPAERLSEADLPIPDDDRRLLIDHAQAGCIALWCEAHACGHPLVFRRRIIKSCIPCAQLIYCADLDNLGRLAGPVGRYLARIGLPFVLIMTNGPIRGLPGIYIDGKYPMYFRGGSPPRLGDLAYTEAGLFGF